MDSWRSYVYTPEPINRVPTQKPLCRGDLVEYRGALWVVYSNGEDFDGYYSIASLTGFARTHRTGINELTRIGTICKKVKRLKAQIGDKNEHSDL